MKCFAMNKNSMFTNMIDIIKGTEETCYVLDDASFHKMKREGKCGTYRCPFFKTKRSEIRKY